MTENNEHRIKSLEDQMVIVRKRTHDLAGIAQRIEISVEQLSEHDFSSVEKKADIALERIETHMHDCLAERLRNNEFRTNSIAMFREFHKENQDAISRLYTLAWKGALGIIALLITIIAWLLTHSISFKFPS